MLSFLFCVFAAMSAFAGGNGFDHSHAKLGSFYGQSISSKGVDYEQLASRRAHLDAYLNEIAGASLEEFSRDQKLALWINAYNAFTVKLILDENQPKSIMDLDGGKVWDTRKFSVAGQQLTLNEIEHKRARPLTDGRIHAALNCASKGCPPLGAKPLRSDGMGAQLDAAARRWVATNAFVRSGKGIAISHIFEWFPEDFKRWGESGVPGVGAKEGAALRFLIEFGGQATEDLGAGKVSVTYNPYDWTLNRR